MTWARPCEVKHAMITLMIGGRLCSVCRLHHVRARLGLAIQAACGAQGVQIVGRRSCRRLIWTCLVSMCSLPWESLTVLGDRRGLNWRFGPLLRPWVLVLISMIAFVDLGWDRLVAHRASADDGSQQRYRHRIFLFFSFLLRGGFTISPLRNNQSLLFVPCCDVRCLVHSVWYLVHLNLFLLYVYFWYIVLHVFHAK